MYPVAARDGMKQFTVEEAQDALARVRPLAEAMVAAFDELRVARRRLVEVQRVGRNNGDSKDAHRVQALNEAVERASGGLARTVQSLEAMGVLVKDLETGLLDFPTHNPKLNEIVLLCWRVGEAAIGYWHGFDEGYVGRKPLPF